MKDSSLKKISIIIFIFILFFFVALFIFLLTQIPGAIIFKIIIALVIAVLLIPLDIIYGAGKGGTYVSISYIIKDYLKQVSEKKGRDNTK